MRSTRKKLTILTLILSAIAFLYFGLRTVWLQVEIRHLKLERTYLDHLIEAKKIELKSFRSPSFNARLLKQNLSLNDSEIPLPVSQVKPLRVSNPIEWYHWSPMTGPGYLNWKLDMLTTFNILKHTGTIWPSPKFRNKSNIFNYVKEEIETSSSFQDLK